jgi:hypothetical protein
MDCFVAAIGRAGAVVLSSNMVDVGLHQMVPLVMGDVTSLRATPARNL